MEFIVPQFIERETKILGPLGFKQTVFVVLAVGICIIIYYTVKNLIVFLIVSSFVAIIVSLFLFYKKEGFSLPELIKNFTSFLTQSRVYLWKRKTITPKFEKRSSFSKKTMTENIKEESPVRLLEKSNLHKLQNFLETRTK